VTRSDNRWKSDRLATEAVDGAVAQEGKGKTEGVDSVEDIPFRIHCPFIHFHHIVEMGTG
jgi:hypothetical protein